MPLRAWWVILSLLWGAGVHAQTWVHVQAQIQQLDAQLDSFASQKLATSDEVLMARARIRVRVIARDLLSRGARGDRKDEVAMAAILYGTTVTDSLDALDGLFALLPNMGKISDPSPAQRKRYLLMRPGLVRFSKKPMRQLKLDVTGPQQVRNLVADAFAPLLDVLVGADLPLAITTWPHAKKMPTLDQIQKLAQQTPLLAARKCLDQLARAVTVAAYQPKVALLYDPLQAYLKLHQDLTADRAMFLRARPIFEQRFDVAIKAYPNTAKMRELVAFGPLVGQLAQLNEQLLDTVALQNLLAVAVGAGDMELKWSLLQWMTGAASLRMMARKEKRFEIDVTALKQASQRLQDHPREVLLPQTKALLKATRQTMARQLRQWRLPRQLEQLQQDQPEIRSVIEKLIQRSQAPDGQMARQLVWDFGEQAEVALNLVVPSSVQARFRIRRQKWLHAWIEGHIASAAGYWAGLKELLDRQSPVPFQKQNALALLQIKTDVTLPAREALKAAVENLRGDEMVQIRSRYPDALAILDLLRESRSTLERLPLGVSGILSQLCWAPGPEEYNARLAACYAQLGVLLNEANHPQVRANARRHRVLLKQCKAVGRQILNLQSEP